MTGPARRMAHPSSEGCPTHWVGQFTKAAHGEESSSPMEDGGAVAGQGCYSAKREMSAMLTVATTRKGVSCLWSHGSVADKPSCCPVKHVAVLVQTWLCQGCYQPATERGRAAETGPFQGEAVMLCWLAWLDDSMMALENVPWNCTEI